MSEKIQAHYQNAVLNKDDKLVKVVINTIFQNAGRFCEWPDKYGLLGIQIHQEIMEYVHKYKAKLIIHVTQNDGEAIDTDYYIDYKTLKYFISNHKCFRSDGGLKYQVIPWKIFYNAQTYNPLNPIPN